VSSNALFPAFSQPIEAAPSGVGQASLSERQAAGLWAMTRPINVAPSYLLVLLGAWASGGRAALSLASVWATAGVCALISSSSCVFNDWFDFAAGVDAANQPAKPLPSGLVTPEQALLAAFAGYSTALVMALLVADARVRAVVAASAVATLVYTPLAKPVFLLKNATVAVVVAAAPLAGAFAAGGAGAGLRAALLPPCAFLFLGTLYRGCGGGRGSGRAHRACAAGAPPCAGFGRLPAAGLPGGGPPRRLGWQRAGVGLDRPARARGAAAPGVGRLRGRSGRSPAVERSPLVELQLRQASSGRRY
jgi:hypothetical protein